MPISGIFDLEPIALGVLNDKLALSADEIEKLSPLRNLPARAVPLKLFAGGGELPELRRQSQDYLEALRATGPAGFTLRFFPAITIFPSWASWRGPMAP